MGPLNFGPNYFPIKNNEKKMIILRLLPLWFLLIVPPKMIPNSKITLILTLLMNLKNVVEYSNTDFHFWQGKKKRNGPSASHPRHRQQQVGTMSLVFCRCSLSWYGSCSIRFVMWIFLRAKSWEMIAWFIKYWRSLPTKRFISFLFGHQDSHAHD